MQALAQASQKLMEIAQQQHAQQQAGALTLLRTTRKTTMLSTLSSKK
jgi:molecular chaperone DnaK